MADHSPSGNEPSDLAEYRHRLRHSTSHVMAGAVLELFPEAKLAIGPPTEDGFYDDFLVSRPFTPDDPKAIPVFETGAFSRSATSPVGTSVGSCGRRVLRTPHWQASP